MAVKRDNIHYNIRPIQGYDKEYNFVMSAREPGKTTSAVMDLIYNNWKKTKEPRFYMVRNSVEITPALIGMIFDININKFTDDNVVAEYKISELESGILDIRIKGELFIRIVSMSISLRRIKQSTMEGAAGAVFDEYIIDPRSGEKYLKNEAFKIKEAYTTWKRGCHRKKFKMRFFANPYTLYNPLFIDWNIPLEKLRKGQIYSDSTHAIEWALISPELREKLLKENPNYQFDEDYAGYALEGNPINDRNIKLSSMPNNYFLRFVFRYKGKYLGIFQNNYFDIMDDSYYCKFIDSTNRAYFTFEFDELMNRGVIFSSEEKNRLNRFKIAMRNNKVSFADINAYYFTQEIYYNI